MRIGAERRRGKHLIGLAADPAFVRLSAAVECTLAYLRREADRHGLSHLAPPVAEGIQ